MWHPSASLRFTPSTTCFLPLEISTLATFHGDWKEVSSIEYGNVLKSKTFQPFHTPMTRSLSSWVSLQSFSPCSVLHSFNLVPFVASKTIVFPSLHQTMNLEKRTLLWPAKRTMRRLWKVLSCGSGDWESDAAMEGLPSSLLALEGGVISTKANSPFQPSKPPSSSLCLGHQKLMTI